MENKSRQVSPFMVFFLINSIQVGIGVLGFQRMIIKHAGNDGWMAVIMAGISVHLILWIMFRLLGSYRTDLVGIHKQIFGKWAGHVLNMIWILYWLSLSTIIIRSYVEVVQVWVFPMINVFMFVLILILLVYYCVSGGFRVVAGISLFGVVVPSYLILTFVFPLDYSHLSNLLPVWNHSIKEMGLAAKDVTLSYLGFSTLLMYYPYLKDAKKSQKWAHFGQLATMGTYLLLIVLAIGYFSPAQVDMHIWATLSMWQIVQLPFVERFEYIGITSWILIILPNICLCTWAAAKGLHLIFRVKPQKILVVLLLAIWAGCLFIQDRHMIEKVNLYISTIGFCLVYLYIPFLTVIGLIMNKKRGGA